MKTYYLYNPETFLYEGSEKLAENAPAPDNATLVAPLRHFAMPMYDKEAGIWENAAGFEAQHAFDVANMEFRIVYDAQTRAQQYGMMFYYWEVPENSTAVPYTGNFAKPVLNAEGTAWINAATPAEQSAHEAMMLAQKWAGMRSHYNTEITEAQDSASLNAKYPGVAAGFVVKAPKVGSGMQYEKLPDGMWDSNARAKV